MGCAGNEERSESALFFRVLSAAVYLPPFCLWRLCVGVCSCSGAVRHRPCSLRNSNLCVCGALSSDR